MSESTTTQPPVAVVLNYPFPYRHENPVTNPHIQPPAPAPWLVGRWYVTHSTLPLWKDKRNVSINYEILDDKVRVQDTTSYQTLSANKENTLSGINTPSIENPAAYDWRGKGWLRIASAHWEVLGWGDVDGSMAEGDVVQDREAWVVTFFSKTLFTPAGLDVYSKKKSGLPAEVLAAIRTELSGMKGADLEKLVEELFEVKHDM